MWGTLRLAYTRVWGSANPRFHYRPSLVWPPLPVPDNGVKVKLPDGSEQEVDDQIQLYWCVR